MAFLSPDEIDFSAYERETECKVKVRPASMFADELDAIERSYTQFLGLGQALRLSQPKFMEQFRRMLVSKLRTVFELAGAAGALLAQQGQVVG